MTCICAVLANASYDWWLLVPLQAAKLPIGEPAALQAQSLPLRPPRQQGSLMRRAIPWTLNTSWW